MKILVLYFLRHWKPNRKTLLDHLYAFRNYLPEGQVDYFNAVSPLPAWLRHISYDLIVLHNTLLHVSFREANLWSHYRQNFEVLRQMRGVKVALPQDEYYAYRSVLAPFFKEMGVETIFTCAAPSLHGELYPEAKKCISTFPGFVDEAFVESVGAGVPHRQREIDLSYRAWKVPYLTGRFGQLKYQIGDRFLAHRDVSLRFDISCEAQDQLYGLAWVRFLLNSRAVLGVPGGSSLFDPHGTIRAAVLDFTKKYPEASFEEVEKACFPSEDGKYCLVSLSPRHFECAVARCCQVLLEADYGLGEAFQPGVHYIEVKADFSNIAEVLEQLKDHAFCEQMAERAYQSLIASKRFTASHFVESVVAQAGQPTKQRLREHWGSTLLSLREKAVAWQRLRWRFWYLRHVSLPKRLQRSKS